MQYAIVAVAALIACLVLLKVWARWTAAASKLSAIPATPHGLVFETTASQIDDYVREAERWWPHLRQQWLFWVACFLTCILIMLNFHFGYSRGGWFGFVILGSVFALADVAIPIIALSSDRGVAKWYRFETSDRSGVAHFVIWMCTAMSMFVVLASVSDLASSTGARKDVERLSYSETIARINVWQAERDKIPVDHRGFAALDSLATAAEEAAERESQRIRCGQICEKLKREAADFRARANDAKRKEELTAQIEQARASLADASHTTQTLDSDTMATAIEGVTGGAITRDQARRFWLMPLGVGFVILSTVLWMMIADGLGFAIARERERRGEIADATRATAGLAPKYTTSEPTKLIEGPKTSTTAAEDGLVINISQANMRARYKNDAELLETDSLFDRLLMAAPDGGSVTIAALYRAYQLMILSADPNARYMTQPTMAQKLMTISQHRDDVQITADGVVKGWVLKPTEERV